MAVECMTAWQGACEAACVRLSEDSIGLWTHWSGPPCGQRAAIAGYACYRARARARARKRATVWGWRTAGRKQGCDNYV
eukprot:4330092-Pleurochrysis_carterae.AAC.1